MSYNPNWHEDVAKIYEEHVAVAGFDAMHFGPAHIVWEDGNMEDHHIQWCLDHFDKYVRDFSDEEMAPVRRSLEQLLEVPELDRELPPDWTCDYE